MPQGLTTTQAAKQLKKDGYNELPTAKPKGISAILFGIIREPMVVLLLVAGVLYLLLGDRVEAVLLLFSIFGVVGISLYQEKKSEKSLEALRKLSSPRAIVIRDGQEMRIAGREVVVGDVVVIAEGTRVPADIKLIEAVNLNIDESLLTGESQPVTKNTTKLYMAYSGSLVVKGHGVAEVVATGRRTELGKIGRSLKTIRTQKTLLQKEISTFVRWIAVLGVSLCILLAVLYIATQGKIIEGILAGLTLAIGILPEELPIVLLLFMSLGAWRLAKKHVLTRRSATIETLGAATVLCVDKTGTLTKNKMTIETIFTRQQLGLSGKSDNQEVVEYGILASQKKPFDPMETAFIEEGKKYFSPDRLYAKYELVKEYPLDSSSLSVAHAYKQKGSGYLIALKGAPEAVARLCHLPANQIAQIEQNVKDFAAQGFRVIAVAKAKHPSTSLPQNRHDIKFDMLGLVALADPIRKGVIKSVASAYQAGIRVIMVTGDHGETALNIAEQIGIKTHGALSGEELEAMPEHARQEALRSVSIFSRVLPKQKLMIVEELKKMDEVVAMTGDGVNDAPALKAAHIGIAMGLRGTDVAREASSIVLLDDNFNSIVRGIKTGRRIYDNLQKAVNYLVAVHIPTVILAILPVIFKMPLILMPIHIVFLEFIIDPTCTIVFESDKADDDIMQRPPRKLKDHIVAWHNLTLPILQGFAVGLTVFGAYYYFLNSQGEHFARTIAFILLICLNVALIFTNLSKKENVLKKLIQNDNKALLFVLLFTLIITVLASNFSPLMQVFKFELITPVSFLYALGIAVSFLAVIEVLKMLIYSNNYRTYASAKIDNQNTLK